MGENKVVHYKTWSEEEEQFLRDNYLKYSSKELSNMMGRTEKSINFRKSHLKLKSKDYNPLTYEEREFIKKWYEEHMEEPLDIYYLSEKFGKATSHISREAKRLGLTNANRKRKINAKAT